MANEEGDISPIANNPNNAHNLPNPFDFPYPEEIIRVENAIRKTMRDNGISDDNSNRNFKLLQTFLKDTGSVIAGGALLSWLHGDRLIDIDIYVNVKHLEAARTTLVSFFNINKPSSYINPSIYCKTHMRENGIQKIYTLHHYATRMKIDIMSIRNKKNVVDVVKNFDFTFCQIWYDGENLYATHPEDVRNKRGKLTGIYNKEFIDKFTFIHKRWKKYLRKGYTIDFDKDELEKYIPTQYYNRLCGKATKNDADYYDTWFGHTMLKCIFGNDYYPINTTNRHMQIPVLLYPGESDDGYDSEEFPTLDKFFDIKPEENVYSAYMKLKKDYITPHLEYTFNPDYNLDSGLLKHYQAIVDRSKKKGTCILSKEENINVYYLHQHDVDTDHENSYISPAGLQKYLDANKDDNMEVECFFSGCDKKITPGEVLFIVSNEWYKEYYNKNNNNN
jgi:hypothetical protein